MSSKPSRLRTRIFVPSISTSSTCHFSSSHGCPHAAGSTSTSGPTDIDALVELRHLRGDTFRGGGTPRRDYLVSLGIPEPVEAAHARSVTLYLLDRSGLPKEPNRSALWETDGGTFVFRYTQPVEDAGVLAVTETHTVAQIRPVKLELSSPDDIMNGCCAAVGGTPCLVALALYMLRNSRPRGPLA